MHFDFRIASRGAIGIVIACLYGAISPIGAGIAAATPSSYAISQTGGTVLSGYLVDIGGVAQARPYVGQINQQDVSIDWDDDQNPATFVWVPATSFSITSSGGTGGNKFFFADWTGSHTYASSGTYTVRARVHHQHINGHEGSDVATITITVVIPPPDTDADDDGIDDETDNCPLVANAEQADADEDGIGDGCDADIDGDEVMDEGDNCILTWNADQSDADEDGVGDACDTDADNDTVADEDDNCVSIANAEQADADEDGIGDACDTVAVSSSGGGASGGSTDPSPYENPAASGSSATTTPEVADVPMMPQGEVLGESCAPLLTTYIKFGAKNDDAQVKLLQEFLNKELGLTLVVDGIYGISSKSAVEQFQLKYADEVLAPWLPHGLASKQTPTGYVFKTTQRWINKLHCAELDIPMPMLP